METRSRLSQSGTPSIIVYFDKSDLSNASGDVANIFLSALNTPDYRLAMSVRTTHLVRWSQGTKSKDSETVSMNDLQEILSSDQISEMRNNPDITNIRIIRDEGMYLTFFAADQDTQREIEKTADGVSSETPHKQNQILDDTSIHAEQVRGSLEGFMRPKS